MDNMFFPYKQIRPVQDQLIDLVRQSLSSQQDLVVHAPTGLGKTVGVLAPALYFALKNDLTIFFLTSRHTQHHLAIETLKDIKKVHDVDFWAADIIGKKWMCAQPGAMALYSNEFAEFCKKMREESTCEFYENTRANSKLSVKALQVMDGLSSAWHTGEIQEACEKEKLCPYEIALAMAAKANVIIADYYYLFHPSVSENFLKRVAKNIDKSIIVIDEGHNLPFRIRDLASTRLSSSIIRRAISEAKKNRFEETIGSLAMIQDVLNELSVGLALGKEKIVDKTGFKDLVSKEDDYDNLTKSLGLDAEIVRERQRQSYIGSVAGFLESWKGPEDGFARIISISDFQGRPNIILKNSCLDPAIVSRPIIDDSYCTIIMSGTLTPTEMYSDLLGFRKPKEVMFPNPFPKKNRLNLIIPRTTTKFTARSNAQFENIAKVCADITDRVPGNSILVFPSYYIRDTVYKSFGRISQKTCFTEKPGLTKDEKQELLGRFKAYQKTGAVLGAVASGSFSEGIDLPGELLKCVVIIGLPFIQPDLETRELIEYYEKKYGKGWDYGYIFPAFNRVLQAAGRCIRSETDRGAVVFLDERYLWPRYKKLFPDGMEIVVSREYLSELTTFFK